MPTTKTHASTLPGLNGKPIGPGVLPSGNSTGAARAFCTAKKRATHKFPPLPTIHSERHDMIKNELINNIKEQIGGISTRELWTYATFIIEEITKAVERGETVKITNFGVFEPRRKRERIGRNPKTLEEATISARTVVRFRASENVTAIINGDESDNE